MSSEVSNGATDAPSAKRARLEDEDEDQDPVSPATMSKVVPCASLSHLSHVCIVMFIRVLLEREKDH